MSDGRRALGSSSEEKAARFLSKKGFHILEKNVHFGRLGEIDLVARDGKVLVFVEVKSRRSLSFGLPALNVDWRKQRKLIRLAEWYLKREKITKQSCRFDVVSVFVPQDGPAQIQHIPNAFVARR